jgi:hypothetical protein
VVISINRLTLKVIVVVVGGGVGSLPSEQNRYAHDRTSSCKSINRPYNNIFLIVGILEFKVYDYVNNRIHLKTGILKNAQENRKIENTAGSV